MYGGYTLVGSEAQVVPEDIRAQPTRVHHDAAHVLAAGGAARARELPAKQRPAAGHSSRARAAAARAAPPSSFAPLPSAAASSATSFWFR